MLEAKHRGDSEGPPPRVFIYVLLSEAIALNLTVSLIRVLPLQQGGCPDCGRAYPPEAMGGV